ncbi:translation initiation factor IF-2-like [Pollicipes pollicipes]|uniref:translation initiation factor IF-2-like n=1 Tax=Pollicipes pollicipes TaxID=41117 RepID=UPI001884C859|nr:translation initiation factor IF-2-like [Pollicipes pollicipes]
MRGRLLQVHLQASDCGQGVRVRSRTCGRRQPGCQGEAEQTRPCRARAGCDPDQTEGAEQEEKETQGDDGQGPHGREGTTETLIPEIAEDGALVAAAKLSAERQGRRRTTAEARLAAELERRRRLELAEAKSAAQDRAKMSELRRRGEAALRSMLKEAATEELRAQEASRASAQAAYQAQEASKRQQQPTRTETRVLTESKTTELDRQVDVNETALEALEDDRQLLESELTAFEDLAAKPGAAGGRAGGPPAAATTAQNERSVAAERRRAQQAQLAADTSIGDQQELLVHALAEPAELD